MTSQDQPALPAWLKTLRAGEQPSPSPAHPTSSKFSPADVLEEGLVPSWMEAHRDESQNVTGATPSLRSASFPAPITNGANLPIQGFSVRSLVDEQALPTWMKEGETPAPALPTSGTLPTHEQSLSDGMPDWMRSLQQSAMAEAAQQSQATSTIQKITPPSGLAARDLLDSEAVPSWMAQLGQEDAAGMPQEPAQKTGGLSARDLIDPEAVPSWMAQPDQSDATPSGMMRRPSQPLRAKTGGLSARDLVDPEAVPSWMAQSDQSDATPSGMMRRSSQPLRAKTGELSARDLVDPEAVPTWMEQLDQPTFQASQPIANLPASSLLDVNALPSWIGEDTSTKVNEAQAGPKLPASSLLDVNALPSWLGEDTNAKANEAQDRYPAGSFGQAKVAKNVPSVESPRVPSRPRTEINLSETNEMAATVFASMLGVASAAPNSPAPAYQPQPNQLSYIGQMSMSGIPGAGVSMPGVEKRDDPQIRSKSSQADDPQKRLGNAYGSPQSMPGNAYMNQQSMPGNTYGSPQSMSGDLYGNPQSMPGNTYGSPQSMPGNAYMNQQSMPGNAYGSPQSMPGNAYMNQQSMLDNMPMQKPPDTPPAGGNAAGAGAGPRGSTITREQKKPKKRGLFGMLLDWLSR